MPNVWSTALGRTTGLAAALFLAGVWPAAEVRSQGYGWRRLEPQAARPVAPPAGTPGELELQAAGDVIDRIEAGRESLQDGRMRTEPVTDVLVRIRHAVRRFRGAQTTGNEATHSYVEAQLRLVSGGRISQAATAQCEGFDGDMLVCTIDCDGGKFGLRRGRSPGEHFLVVGTMAEPGAEARQSRTDRPGFRLGGCGAGASANLVLPRGGRLAAEVRLLETGTAP